MAKRLKDGSQSRLVPLDLRELFHDLNEGFYSREGQDETCPKEIEDAALEAATD